MLVGITGATGFIGMVHVARCVKHGEAVRVLVRSSHPWSQSAPEGVEVVVGDLADQEAMNEFQFVVYCTRIRAQRSTHCTHAPGNQTNA